MATASGVLHDIVKAYDVRGTYPDQFNADVAYALGVGFARFCGAPTVLVARDMRPSGPELVDAFARGAMEQGVDVIDLGLAGWAMSRFTGVWVAMKTTAETMEQASTAIVRSDVSFATPDIALPAHGLNYDHTLRFPAERAELERRLFDERMPAVLAWALGWAQGWVLARLSELMFIEVVRRYLDKMPAGQTGWLAGLRDPFVGKALSQLHARPAHNWTIEELAHDVALSRSVLAERFNDLVGMPPMHYLAHWRMQIAAGLLAGNANIATVAAETGYGSEAAFSRAFKKMVGVSPSAWRERRK